LEELTSRGLQGATDTTQWQEHGVQIGELTLKALLEVGLDIGRVARLAQDLQQVVTGQEVEARELLPLGLQVGVQALLHLLQLGIHGLHHTPRQGGRAEPVC
jgi:hypothetical protein